MYAAKLLATILDHVGSCLKKISKMKQSFARPSKICNVGLHLSEQQVRLDIYLCTTDWLGAR